ncbi:hypothetical protein [Crenobacter intestini]|uniref:Uncharacterized protein n=1 Tax=Crenobacter intestini TaxID=2563443 RepID=A0A4T0UNJ3_9NEIS|nr:hypothetical protein [Crenobacter intestini]TIC80310.1 hypothetical protein E5K04_12455 [Crenobacter intestini]
MNWVELSLYICLFVAIVLLFAGASRRVIIYFDLSEVMVSLLAVLLPVFCYIMYGSGPFENWWARTLWEFVATPLAGLFGVLFFALNFIQAWNNSGSALMALVVGVFRLFFVAFFVVIVFGQLERLEKRKASEKIGAVLVIFLAGMLARALVNGMEVRHAQHFRPK